MTQCWQHCPEHRPNFTTILERINYCTQVKQSWNLIDLEIWRIDKESFRLFEKTLSMLLQTCKIKNIKYPFKLIKKNVC